MKLVVIGLGQCGGRIADHFARLNMKAHSERDIDLIAGIFAVNTDVADLTGLNWIRPDHRHRILIGNNRTGGHGVGKINELAAEIASDDADKIIEAIRTSERFPEADAFLLIAGAAGGTGSGSISVITRHIKERYLDKPVYNLIVLPFRHEEETERRTVYNVATCLKSAYLVADAILLVDNQHYMRSNTSMARNLAHINTTVVTPFYNVLSAGEEKRPQYIGSKTLDAGDIVQTMSGWSVIGHGSYSTPRRGLFGGRKSFRETTANLHHGLQAMQQALSNLSLHCQPQDAHRGLYLVSAPAEYLSLELIREFGSKLREAAPEAIIRSGDYPREKGKVELTVILSELANVSRVTEYFNKAIDYIYTLKKRRERADYETGELKDLFRDIPSLL